MEPFKCYQCKRDFVQIRAIGEYAECPDCGSMDVVVNPREERGNQLVQTGWKSDGQMAGNGGSK